MWKSGRDCIECGDQLGKYCHLNNVNASEPWTWYIFLFRSFFLLTIFCSFQSIYFICLLLLLFLSVLFFGCYCKCSCFLFSDCSLPVHRNTVDFCCVDLVSFNLIELFTSSNSFWLFVCLFLLNSWGFSIYKIMSSVSKDSFTSSFPICKPSIFLPLNWLIYSL